MTESRQQSLGDWLRLASKNLATETAATDCELLLAFRLRKNRAYLRAFSEDLLTTAQYRQLQNDLQQLHNGYPLAYIMGEQDFWDMTLKVSAATLIPRPDTETLIEVVQTLLAADFTGGILDLGTGSGAIAIALSREFPHARISACDYSKEALQVAADNAQQWQRAPIHFFHANWFTPLENPVAKATAQALTDKFTVIVANPPYIAADDEHLQALQCEPQQALVAADNGLADIRTIVAQAPNHLQPGGWLAVEHGYNQGRQVRNLFGDANASGIWQPAVTYRDLGGNDRVTAAQRRDY